MDERGRRGKAGGQGEEGGSKRGETREDGQEGKGRRRGDTSSRSAKSLVAVKLQVESVGPKQKQPKISSNKMACSKRRKALRSLAIFGTKRPL